MKIMVVIPSLDEKGPIIVAQLLAKYSTNPDIEYVFCSLRKNSPNLKAIYSELGIKVIEVGMHNFPTLKVIHEIRKIVTELNPSIIHAHAFWPTVLVPILEKKIPTIVTVHNNPIEDYSYEYGKIKGIIMTKCFMFFLRFYNQIIPISNYVENKIKNRFTKNKLKIVYNGIEDYYDDYVDLNNSKDLKIISISVLNKRKSVIDILKVVKLTKEKGLSIHCNIIGNGPEKRSLENFVTENNLTNNINFLGEMPRNEVFNYLKKADVFVLSSNSEGLGLVVIEAMMMGKPVVVKNIPVMNEIVNNKTGFLFDTAEEFFNALLLLKNNDLKAKMSKHAREKYLSEFSVLRMTASYEEVYGKMLHYYKLKG